jgi:hypothetical protein
MTALRTLNDLKSYLLRGEGLPLWAFLAVCLGLIIASRVFLIVVTPGLDRFNDVQINHGVGQMIVSHVDLYDAKDHPEKREAIRQDIRRATPLDTDPPSLWQYYLTSNLPLNNLQYGLFEAMSGGSIFVWRLLFIVGDVLIFLGAYFAFLALRGPPTKLIDQLAIGLLTCVYPSLLISGTIIAEDKQYQTAAMLAFVAVCYGTTSKALRQDILCGLLLSVSVLYKIFGIFLIPLFLARYVRAGFGRFLAASIAGLIPLLGLFAYFGPGFIQVMAARGRDNSLSPPAHSSPWVLLAPLDNGAVLALRVGVTVALAVALSYLLYRKRIDLLNYCAALFVIFDCVWLTKGGINRMNISMMFATITLASLSVGTFRALAIGATLFQLAAYPALYLVLDHRGSLGGQLQRIEAMVTASFLVGYFAVLFRRTAPLGSASSPAPAAERQFA